MYAAIVSGLQAIFRVRTDPGKVWNVQEFNVEIFKAVRIKS